MILVSGNNEKWAYLAEENGENLSFAGFDELKNLCGETVVIILENSEIPLELADMLIALDRLITSGNKIIAINIGVADENAAHIFMYLIANRVYALYNADSAETLDAGYLKNAAARKACVSDVENYLQDNLVDYNSAYTALEILRDCAARGDIDALSAALRENEPYVRKALDLLLCLKSTNDILAYKAYASQETQENHETRENQETTENPEFSARLQGLQSELEAKNIELNDKTNRVLQLEADNAALGVEIKNSEGKIAELVWEINVSGVQSYVYKPIALAAVKTNLRHVIYFKELSYVKYINTFVIFLQLLLRTKNKYQVKLLIYDRLVDITTQYPPLPIIGAREFEADRERVLAAEQLVIVDPNRNILNDFLTSSHDVIIIYDRLGGKDGRYDKEVIVISLGRKNVPYFDPLQIGDLTGEPDIDDDLQSTAIDYTMATLRVIVESETHPLKSEMESVLSRAIKEVYYEAGVTSDPKTWHKSKGLRIESVYKVLREWVDQKTLADPETDNAEHKAAAQMIRSLRPYFEKGEAKYGTFARPLDITTLFNAKFIVFSFGMKGQNVEQVDAKLLALKQLSVASIAIQISNYCKYALGKFNVKVWEEFQRYGAAKGTANTIINAFTGGRKRGDVNFLITTNLDEMLAKDNKVCAALLDSFSGMIIGRIKSLSVRQEFCRITSREEILAELGRIAEANTDEEYKIIEGAEEDFAKIIEAQKRDVYKKMYKHAFCLLLDNGKISIARARAPQSVLMSGIFDAGVDVMKTKKKNEK
jgi:hypothetical protein